MMRGLIQLSRRFGQRWQGRWKSKEQSDAAGADASIPAYLAGALHRSSDITDELQAGQTEEAISKDGVTATASGISAAGEGQPLPEALRADIEPLVGDDLRDVLIHSDVQSRYLADQLHARAFTYGRDIWLGEGEQADDPGLLAHEAAHAAQQAQGPAGIQRKSREGPANTIEQVQHWSTEKLIREYLAPASVSSLPHDLIAAELKERLLRVSSLAELQNFERQVIEGNGDRTAATELLQLIHQLRSSRFSKLPEKPDRHP